MHGIHTDGRFINQCNSQAVEFMRFAGGGMTLGQNSRPLQPLEDRTFDYNI